MGGEKIGTMEAGCEGDELIGCSGIGVVRVDACPDPSVLPGELDGCLIGLGARVAEKNLI